MFHYYKKRIASLLPRASSPSTQRPPAPLQTEQPSSRLFSRSAVPAAVPTVSSLQKTAEAIAAELSQAVGSIEGVAAIESAVTAI